MSKTGDFVGFILITLSENICFRHDWLNLKVDISSFLCIYFSCLLRQVFVEIQLVLFTCLWRDVTKRTIYFLILQNHIVFQPFAVSNDTLFWSVQSKWVFLVIFTVIMKKTWLVRSSTPEGYIAQASGSTAKIDCVWKWWPHCFRHTAPGTHCRTSTINMGAEQNIRRIHTLNRVHELAVRYRKAVQQM